MCEILGKGGKGTGTYANKNLLQISNLMVTPQFHGWSSFPHDIK